ncbi:L-type lectin-domain containing receptor kinase S.4 [Lactuca sativa]|nr:L-type lectin-domain containing receptor kinase S.4 [Lactuca sativa]
MDKMYKILFYYPYTRRSKINYQYTKYCENNPSALFDAKGTTYSSFSKIKNSALLGILYQFQKRNKEKTERFFAKSPLMMTWFSFLIVCLIILHADPTFSISLRFFSSNLPAETGHSLLGDAHFVDGGHAVQLSRTTPLSFGIMLHSTPYKFSSSTSFSSNFTFEIGNGVALVIIPADFPSKFARNMSFGLQDVNRFFGIEFDVNVCKISSSRVSNVSKNNNVLKSGVNLTSWVNYFAISNQLDVRVSKSGDSRPVEPLISHHINLGEMLNGKEVLLGLASINEKPEQITTVYSWTSDIKDIPKWMHSIPVFPLDSSTQHHDVKTYKKKVSFLSGFIVATGCGALAALALFFVWAFVADKQKAQGEPSVHPVDFKYEKIGVLEANNTSESAMK